VTEPAHVAAGEVRCPTCLYRARWSADGEVLAVEQEGGARAPDPHPTLVSWRIWHAARQGGDRVVGACPQCAMPVLSADLPWADAWTLASKHGPIRVGHDLLEGPAGALDDATVDAWMVDEFQPRFVDQLLDVRLFFVAVVLGILGLVLLGWLGAIGYLVNWFIAMANQGNFSGPVGL